MEKSKLDEIIEYASKRGIDIPPDLLLDLANQKAEGLFNDLFARIVITPEMLPLFTMGKPGAVPAPKQKGLVLGSTGWSPAPEPGKVVYRGGWGYGVTHALGLPIADEGGYYDGTNVEAALQEVGNSQIKGIYGGIHVHDNTTPQVIPTGTTYTKMTAFNDSHYYSNMTPDVSNNKITVLIPGRYEFLASISGYSGSANVVFKYSAFLNNAEQDQVHSERKYTVANDIGSAVVSGILDVTAANLDVDLRCRHDAGGNVNLVVTYASIVISYLGST